MKPGGVPRGVGQAAAPGRVSAPCPAPDLVETVPVQPAETVELLVCTCCRRPEATDSAERAGTRLFRRLAEHGLPGVTVRPVECLSNCSQGCTVALRGRGRWTYVYGRLDDGADVDAVLEGAARYRATDDGIVPWRDRPEHFRRNCIARIPPLES